MSKLRPNNINTITGVADNETIDTSGRVDDKIAAALIFNLHESFTATVGQVSFTILGDPPVSPATTRADVDGITYEYGVTNDFTISGNTLTWYTNNYTMQAGDVLQIWYDVSGLGGSVTKTVYLDVVEPNSNLGNGRYRGIGSTGSYRLSFSIPGDFASWAANGCTLEGVPAAAAATTGRDIDYSGERGNLNESYNNISFSDLTTAYDLTGTSGKITTILDFTTNLAGTIAGDGINVFVDHKGIGSGGIDYKRFALNYNT